MTALVALNSVVAALDSALLHFVWQGMVVALVLWVVLAALRRRSANARYLACCAAMAMLAAMPVVTAWRSYERPAPVDGAAIAIVQIVTRVDAAADAAAEGVDWLVAAQHWMAPVWACGVLLLSLRMLWGCAKVSRLKREGEKAEPAVLEMVERLAGRVRVSRPVRVLMSKLADGPSVVGWIKPVLLLPAATVLGLSAEQLEAVLAHELAHIRRYDYLVNLGQMLMETLFFYHPAVWWISRRMREERELCCDDIAVRVCGDAVCYARALTALERMRVAQPAFAMGAVLGAKAGPLMYRIERLLGVARREPAPSRLPGMVAICLVLACLAPSSNPAKAQASVQQAPLSAAPVPAAPAMTAPALPRPTPRMIAQAVQPSPAPVTSPPQAEAEDLTVEVTIDSNGDVSDARVVSGNQESRKQALLTALNMHFSQDDGPATRWVTVQASGPVALVIPTGTGVYSYSASRPRPVLTRGSAQERIADAKAQIARLQALQVGASDRGRVQLQETIDSYTKGLVNAELSVSGPDPLIGAELTEIRVDGAGISDAERIQVRSKLPIHLHDILTDASMRAAVDAVKAMYPNATAYFGRFDSGKASFLVTLPRAVR